MGFDLNNTWDSIKDGISETAEVAQVKTNEFHEKYVSKITPDFGKYGDAAKFAAEMVPGVSEYNAIKDGDWQAFAIAAGIDIAALAIGAFTAGAGYAAVKGGTSVAKAGVKVAVKEVAEAGAKKVVKETVEAGAKKVVKETVEAGAEKIVKETVETGAEKIVKETVEVGAEKIVKETVEAGVEKAVKETVEAGAEKAVKQTVETGAEKAVKETAETGTEKVLKETAEEAVEKTDDVVYRFMECRNQGLEGTQHPVTGVEFARKTVDDGTGELVEGVFPKFKSEFDTKIPEELYKSSNDVQFKKANEQLLEKIDSTPDLKNKFNAEQLEQIKDGLTPDGYVWHHNEESGVLQLVNFGTHSQTGHTGGRAIWGGGY